jgi:Ca-activated chloride channel family protein
MRWMISQGGMTAAPNTLDPMRCLYRRFSTASLLAAALTMPIVSDASAACSNDRDVLFIVDASVSMLYLGLGGLNRFDAARAAIVADLDLLPSDGRVALRFFGSQSPAVRTDCRDSDLAVPFRPAASNKALIIQALAAAAPQGITPMAYALQEAMSDFPPGAVDPTIIVISDGGENCGGDVCAAATALARDGVVVNAVAIQADDKGQQQLQCISRATGGEYFPVPTTTVLADAIEQALDVCPVAEQWPLPPTVAAG